MKTKLSEWADLAEVLGAVAIVLSLIFVGLELRANANSTQASTFLQHSAYEMEFLKWIADDPELVDLHYRMNSDPDGLSEQERRRAGYMHLAELRLWENLFMQWHAGLLADELWYAREAVVRGRVLSPTFDPSTPLADAFADYVESVRDDAGQ